MQERPAGRRTGVSGTSATHERGRVPGDPPPLVPARRLTGSSEGESRHTGPNHSRTPPSGSILGDVRRPPPTAMIPFVIVGTVGVAALAAPLHSLDGPHLAVVLGLLAANVAYGVRVALRTEPSWRDGVPPLAFFLVIAALRDATASSTPVVPLLACRPCGSPSTALAVSWSSRARPRSPCCCCRCCSSAAPTTRSATGAGPSCGRSSSSSSAR